MIYIRIVRIGASSNFILPIITVKDYACIGLMGLGHQ